MHLPMKSTLLLLTATLSTAPAAVLSFTDAAGAAIPDGDSAGLLRTIDVNAPGENILGVEVDLRISPGQQQPAFLGDLYLYLSNGTSLAVLANRAGRRDGVPAGYNDSQTMNVTFSTTGADIHNYRVTLNGSHNSALTGPLTGIWQADARAVDPSLVLDTSLRTAGLDLFAGQPSTGTWRLFAADISSGAVHQLDSWTLRLTTIPEPGSSVTLLLAGALLCRPRRRAGRTQ
jgi:hypothetical protein